MPEQHQQHHPSSETAASLLLLASTAPRKSHRHERRRSRDDHDLLLYTSSSAGTAVHTTTPANETSLRDYISKSPLLRYATSSADFWFRGKSQQKQHKAGQHVLLLREDHVSLDHLNPAPGCSSRKSSAMIAMVNLIATVCGGGVLSLPLAFARAGIVPTTILMLFGAASTDFALVCLVDSARKTGGRTYGDVAASAFGSGSQVITTIMLGLMLCGSLIGYQVLVKDIWTPVVFFIASSSQGIVVPTSPQHLPLLQQGDAVSSSSSSSSSSNRDEPTPQQAQLLLAAILVLISPLLLKTDLHALRHTCYVGFGSCILLMVAVVYRACEKLSQLPHSVDLHTELNWWTDRSADILFAFPIVTLSYFCSYNVLAVHSQMIHPTRRRIRMVLGLSMTVCCTIFFCVGLCGYLYTFDTETPDNILLAFDLDDKAILAGRVGFCFTLLFGLPLVLLPCREALVSLPNQWRSWRRDVELVAHYQNLNETYRTTHHHHLQSPYITPPLRSKNAAGGDQRNYGATSTATLTSLSSTETTSKDDSPHLVVNGVDFDGVAPTLIYQDPEKRHGVSIVLPSLPNDKSGGDISPGPATNTVISSLSKGEDTCTTELCSEAHDEECGAVPLLEDDEDHCVKSPPRSQQQQASHFMPTTQTTIPSSSTQTYHAKPMIQISIQPLDDHHNHHPRTVHAAKDSQSSSFAYHVLATALILAPTYVVAIVVPGVSSVWSIVGSSLTIWIAFVVPTACYLRIRQHKGLTMQALYAWLLLLFALVAMVLCTRQAILNVLSLRNAGG